MNLIGDKFKGRVKNSSKLAGADEGSVLIIVLWIAFGLVSTALYFANSMSFEMRAADNRVAATEASQAIEGAARYVTTLLSNNISILPGSVPDTASYQSANVPVGDSTYWFLGRADQQTSSSVSRGNLTSGSALGNNTTDEPSFGLVDEASKLNLNTATVEMLELLPRMTPELAAAIIDWRDTDENVSQNGAESDVYARLKPAYLCKNAPFETVEELRLVYGMDMEVLYGEDTNMNGILDSNENDGQLSLPMDNRDGRLDAGIASFLTVFTREPNIRTNMSSRVNIRSIVPQAQGGVGGGGRGGGGGGGVQQSAGQRQLSALLQEKGIATDRIGQIVARFNTGPATIRSTLEFYMRSGMTPEEFAQICQDITAATGDYIPGLVNVNTASLEVLACIPGIGATNAQTVLSYRLSNPDQLTSVAWVAQVLDSASAIQAGPYLTSQSYQFTADIAAVGHHGRGYRRERFVFDTSNGTVKVLSRRDLTQLGWALGQGLKRTVLMAKSTR